MKLVPVQRYCTVRNQRNTVIPSYIGLSVVMMIDVTSSYPIMIYVIKIDKLLVVNLLYLLETGSNLSEYRS